MSTGNEDDLADLPWPKPAAPSADVTCAIREHCTKGLCAKRGATAGQRVLACLVLATATIGLTFWLAKGTGRPEGAIRSGLYGAAGWGIVMAAILFAGLARPPGRRGGKSWRVAVAVVVPVLFLLYLVYLASTSTVAFGTFSTGAHAAHAMRCGFAALVIGTLVSGGMLLSFRRTDPLSPGISGALAGLAGGLTAALGFGIGCPSDEAWHLVFSHGFVVVVLLLVGWRVGRRVLSP